MHATAGSNSKSLLSVTGALEAATGLALLVMPSVVVELLLGSSPGTLSGVTVSRVAGVALFALGVVCWLAREDAASRAAKGLVAAMLLYNIAVAAVLAHAGLVSGLVGIGLWPGIVLHVSMAVWCIVFLRIQRGFDG